MRLSFTTLAIVASLLLPSSMVSAQPAPDLSGHWEGAVQIPDAGMQFQVDLTKNSTGETVGAISMPAQNLKGIPLLLLSRDGKSITFYARKDQVFSGGLSDDGKWIVGEFHMSNYAIPFSINRIGEARVEPPTRLPPVGRDLEGVWKGSVGADERLVLTLTNQPDGTATGTVVNLDEGELILPISAITRNAPNVTLEFKAIGGSYSGVLAPAGNELVGTYTQGAVSAPLTFRREGK